jgi:hypothetical protein
MMHSHLDEPDPAAGSLTERWQALTTKLNWLAHRVLAAQRSHFHRGHLSLLRSDAFTAES